MRCILTQRCVLSTVNFKIFYLKSITYKTFLAVSGVAFQLLGRRIIRPFQNTTSTNLNFFIATKISFNQWLLQSILLSLWIYALGCAVSTYNKTNRYATMSNQALIFRWGHYIDRYKIPYLVRIPICVLTLMWTCQIWPNPRINLPRFN